MLPDLISFFTPFAVAAIATAVTLLVYYPKHHKVKPTALLAFWLVVSIVFVLMNLIPASVAEFPFLYFILQAILVYLLVRYFWKWKLDQTLIFTIFYTLISLGVIVAIGFLLRGYF